MLRSLFTHEYTEQKEFENLHSSTIKSMNRVNKLETKANWLKGNIEPSNAIGNNGDFYLDKITGNVYTKDNGIWFL